MRSLAAALATIVFTLAVAAAAHAAHGGSETASTSAHAADGPPVAPREPVVDDPLMRVPAARGRADPRDRARQHPARERAPVPMLPARR
jgi:hypothetical protein